MKNISLIGMAGVGKSFISKLLAQVLNYDYISIDDLITKEAEKINANMDQLDEDTFKNFEEKVVLSIGDRKNLIIDTGGSTVYSERAMNFLRESSLVVYLFDQPENVKKRFNKRGEIRLIGMVKGMTFDELMAQRENLYQKYSHIKIDASKRKEDIVSMIVEEYRRFK